jgi:hypothetical protein
MPRAGFESTIPVLERLKTVHALDLAAIGAGLDQQIYQIYYKLKVIAARVAMWYCANNFVSAVISCNRM